MMYLIFINVLLIMIGMILMLLNILLSKKMHKIRSKLSSFECGFDPMSIFRLPFSMHFFLISVIFLIFDVEISLIFPIIKSLINKKFFLYKNIFIMIMIILILGLYYEWKMGSLKWV
uniref:NADH dehydrogenase subunit 3 n=1 Tax=Dryocosmus liui TaxID=2315263 RepID=UPI002263C601|nr:NADH dehydrogenase subunit 3 [Dryocosmus liui]UEE83319.1 NADH dehydrogenase subunit 3 [Dryocosmus liui]